MDSRDPFEILDVAPDCEWGVIQVAYEMLVGQMSDVAGNSEALREIMWAYETLKDPQQRLKYAERNSLIHDGEEDKEVVVAAGKQDKSPEIISVLISSGVFVGMLAAVGFGLYFVGAVRPPGKDVVGQSALVTAVETKTIVRATGIPSDREVESVAHTATVKALHATATRGALLDHTSGLTETIAAVSDALTPAPVEIFACPNVESVNVRNGPGTGFSAIGYILDGDCVRVSGRNEESDWIVINDAPRPSSDGGWVSVELMTVDGGIDDLDVLVSE